MKSRLERAWKAGEFKGRNCKVLKYSESSKFQEWKQEGSKAERGYSGQEREVE